MKLLSIWKENKSFLLFLVLMFMFRSAIADWNHIPSGSMEPTIMIGDRVWVNKIAYDVKLPFINHSVVKIADPARGDIVVFRSEVANKRLIKRIVGLPGDTVAMKNNELYINGKKLVYPGRGVAGKTFGNDSMEIRTENLLGVEHSIRIMSEGSSRSSFNTVRVPEQQYLVLGDSRDNSADSRVIGFMPRDELVGKASDIVMSFNYDNYYLPRSDRFFLDLYSEAR